MMKFLLLAVALGGGCKFEDWGVPPLPDDGGADLLVRQSDILADATPTPDLLTPDGSADAAPDLAPATDLALADQRPGVDLLGQPDLLADATPDLLTPDGSADAAPDLAPATDLTALADMTAPVDMVCLQTEGSVSCGGSCALMCGVGWKCANDNDCTSGTCLGPLPNGLCSDGIRSVLVINAFGDCTNSNGGDVRYDLKGGGQASNPPSAFGQPDQPVLLPATVAGADLVGVQFWRKFGGQMVPADNGLSATVYWPNGQSHHLCSYYNCTQPNSCFQPDPNKCPSGSGNVPLQGVSTNPACPCVEQ